MAEVTQDTLRRAGLTDPFTEQIGRIDARRTPLMERSAELSEEQKRLAAENERLITERGKATEPARDALATKAKEAPPVKVNEESVPDYKRPTIDPEGMRETFSMLMAAAMTMGAGSRQPFYFTMNAMTGAMNGFVKQDAAAVRESMQVFDKNVTAIKERNAQKRREVDDAWKTHQHDLSALKMELELVAAKYDDPLALMAARSKSITEAQKLIENNIKTIDQTTERLLKDRAHVDEVLLRMEEAKARRGEASARLAETSRHNKEMEQIGRDRLDERRAEAQKKAEKGKQRNLPAKVAEDIAGREIVTDMLDDLIKRQEKAMKDGNGYGGYGFDALGNAIIKSGRATGVNQDEALFFSQLESVAQPDRHALFGATLTGGEQNSWRTGWVGAGDSPQTLLNVLKQKRSTYQGMLDGKKKSYAGMGFDVQGAPGAGGGAAPKRLRFDAQGNEVTQ